MKCVICDGSAEVRKKSVRSSDWSRDVFWRADWISCSACGEVSHSYLQLGALSKLTAAEVLSGEFTGGDALLARRLAGLSRVAVARAAKTSASTLARIEGGAPLDGYRDALRRALLSGIGARATRGPHTGAIYMAHDGKRWKRVPRGGAAS